MNTFKGQIEMSRVLTIAALLAIMTGCAMTATSSQMQNLQTETQQLPKGFAVEATVSGVCQPISDHRVQTTPGVTVGHDLQILAREIDSVVKYNGGNAYSIRHWEWALADPYGSTAPVTDITVYDCPSTDATSERKTITS
jgi:hypothetical protein